MRPEDLEYLRMFLEENMRFESIVRLEPLEAYRAGRWRKIHHLKATRTGLILTLSGGVELNLGAVSAEDERYVQRKFLVGLVRSSYPGWRIDRILDRTDRTRHQTGALLRIQMSSVNGQLALLVVYPSESPEFADRVFSALVLWWHQLKQRSKVVRAGLLVPNGWGEHFLDRFPYLEIPVTCFKYEATESDDGGVIGKVRQIYPGPALQKSVKSPYVILPRGVPVPGFLVDLQREYSCLDLSLRHGAWQLSYSGLPVVWQTGEEQWGFDVISRRRVARPEDADLEGHIRQVQSFRRFPPPDQSHPYYRLMPERWLESLVLRNHRLVDPKFVSSIYSQVPTFVDGERKVLDLLTAIGVGRLAVLELKVYKDLGLIFQALDYWDRVRKHGKSGDFGAFGYFPELDLLEDAPELYLVCPLFDYHRVMPVLRRYLKRSVRFKCVGLNSDWRRELKVIRRFEF